MRTCAICIKLVFSSEKIWPWWGYLSRMRLAWGVSHYHSFSISYCLLFDLSQKFLLQRNHLKWQRDQFVVQRKILSNGQVVISQRKFVKVVMAMIWILAFWEGNEMDFELKKLLHDEMGMIRIDLSNKIDEFWLSKNFWWHPHHNWMLLTKFGDKKLKYH